MVAVLLSFAVIFVFLGVAAELGYLGVASENAELISGMALLSGLVTWCISYLIILNKIEYPRYIKFMKEQNNLC